MHKKVVFDFNGLMALFKWHPASSFCGRNGVCARWATSRDRLLYLFYRAMHFWSSHTHLPCAVKNFSKMCKNCVNYAGWW